MNSHGAADTSSELVATVPRLPDPAAPDGRHRPRTGGGAGRVRPERRTPGFDVEEIDLTWDEGVLHVAAAHEDEDREHRRTYHRRFRFPKDIDEDAIEASYTNGILEVRLPIAGTTVSGTPSR